ncbi:hypothetical protein B0H11DRAFT_1905896 [Mycena galericulata]|nr:hypothetical protein B0H11DRAFT_1905896 [Mycena galericulata]
MNQMRDEVGGKAGCVRHDGGNVEVRRAGRGRRCGGNGLERRMSQTAGSSSSNSQQGRRRAEAAGASTRTASRLKDAAGGGHSSEGGGREGAAAGAKARTARARGRGGGGEGANGSEVVDGKRVTRVTRVMRVMRELMFPRWKACDEGDPSDASDARVDVPKWDASEAYVPIGTCGVSRTLSAQYQLCPFKLAPIGAKYHQLQDIGSHYVKGVMLLAPFNGPENVPPFYKKEL